MIENTETDTITKIQYRGIIPKEGEEGASEAQDTFAKKVKEGTLSLGDVPLVIVYWLDWLTWLAGSIAVLFVVIGGYQYSIGGITDDKERGKKTLLYAIAGLIVTFFAWIAVDILQTWLTAMA
ncbi:hypothetical protein KAI58_02215 [Candidatus Gracilibacteria bacterium]|nr:hypothetical protein [Candidatus Gracilibacteria bacterium]